MSVPDRDSRSAANAQLVERLKSAGFENHALQDASLWLHQSFYATEKSLRLFDVLVDEVDWIQPIVRYGGKSMMSPRLAAWFGDVGAVYRYSGMDNIPTPWTEPLLDIRWHLEKTLGCAFNSVLLNYYRSGRDSMGWHRDNERELGAQPVIASISLGERRRFLMQHAKERKLRWQIDLDNGSALIMFGDTQKFWRHCLPKSTVRNLGRINLTFRRIY